MDRSILIVEDEPLIAQDICFLVGDIGIKRVQMAMSYEEAVGELERSSFDLVLLDINLSSDKDGIDLANVINEKYHIPFIFITSYYNPTVVGRAKVTEPKAYLLKPFNKHDVQINVEMALYKAQETRREEVLFLREQTGSISVDQNQIVYLEAADNYTKIYFENRDVTASQTLKTIHEKLSSKDFIRVHKSYCVRLQKVSMIKGGFVYLGDKKIPIGRTYKEDFMSQIALF